MYKVNLKDLRRELRKFTDDKKIRRLNKSQLIEYIVNKKNFNLKQKKRLLKNLKIKKYSNKKVAQVNQMFRNIRGYKPVVNIPNPNLVNIEKNIKRKVEENEDEMFERLEREVNEELMDYEEVEAERQENLDPLLRDLPEEKVTEFATIGNFKKVRYQRPYLEGDVDITRNFYDWIKNKNEFVSGENIFIAQMYVLYFRNNYDNKLRHYTISPNDIFTYEDFMEALAEIEKGDYVDGSGPVSEDEYSLVFTLLDVNYEVADIYKAYQNDCDIFELHKFKKNCVFETINLISRGKADIKDFKESMKIEEIDEKYSKYIDISVLNGMTVESKDINRSRDNFEKFTDLKGKKVYLTKNTINDKIIVFLKNNQEKGYYSKVNYSEELIGMSIITRAHLDVIKGLKEIRLGFNNKIYVKVGERYKELYCLTGLDKKNEKYGINKEIHNKAKKFSHDKNYYIVFDYETVCDYNDNNINKPYSLAFGIYSKDELDKLNKYEKNGNGCENELKNFIDKVEYHEGFDCTRQLYERISDKKYSNVKFYLISFNGANFDNFILYNELKRIDSDCVSQAFYQKSSLLNFKIFGIHSMFDIRKHLVGSLKANCDSFKIQHFSKKEFDHALAQEWFNEGILFEKLKETNIEEYNKYDILSTAVLFTRYKDVIDCKISDIGCLEDFPTIGGMVYKIMNEYWDKNNIKLPVFYKTKYQEQEGENKRLQKFYNDLLRDKTAGRVQLINGKKHHKGKVYSMDVCSLYPFIMAVCDLFYPCGKIIETKRFMKGKIGFYYCDVDQSRIKGKYKNMMKIIGVKENGLNNWESDKVLKKILISTVKIEQLKKYGCIVNLSKDEAGEQIGGFYFTEKISGSELFRPILEFMKEKNYMDMNRENKEIYNAALRECCKLIMNSLSGKLIEGLHLEKIMEMTVNDVIKYRSKSTIGVDVVDVTDSTIIGRIKKSQESEMMNSRPVYMGVLIYDYAQRYMYDNIYSQIPRKYQLYTDTDSCKITEKGFKIWRKYAENTLVPSSKLAQEYDKRLKTHMLFNSETKVFGSFEDEYSKMNKRNNKLDHYFALKKTYLAVEKDLKTDDVITLKKSLKGINPSKDKLIYEDVYEDASDDKKKNKKENTNLYIKDNEGKFIQISNKDNGLINDELLASVYSKCPSMIENNSIIELFEDITIKKINRKVLTQYFKRNVRGTKTNILTDGCYDNTRLNGELINRTQIINRVKKINY